MTTLGKGIMTEMKSLMSLWKVVAQDMGDRCSVDTTKDEETVLRRFENEGSEVLTLILPAYQKSIERWIEEGRIDPDPIPGIRYRAGFPVLFKGFLGLIFDEDGVVRDTASADAILALRQMCGLYGKMKLLSSEDRMESALRQYLETDDEVNQWQSEWTADGDSQFSRISRLLFARVFTECDARINEYALLPKHGPGSTADGLSGNEKFRQQAWPQRLEPYFPSSDYLIPSPSYYSQLESVDDVEPGDELPVKVVLVPKTAKTPRVIAMEPTCMQYAQQAISGELTKLIENDDVLQRIVRFRDQVPNQVLARLGSLTGVLATLDLSEASDRVPNKLVEHMLSNWPHLNGAVQACRSTQASVRFASGEVIHRIAKFASMGSALCFPMEAIVFTTIVFCGIERALGRRLRRDDIESFAGSVAVYGDDIIVPTDYVGSVIHELEAFGFRVNEHKSFWNGKFRESCGKDYYDGVDVSYVKFRQVFPSDRRDVKEIISLVSFFNQANEMHYAHTCDYLRKELVRLLGFFPRVSKQSPLLGEHVDSDFTVDGWDSSLHLPVAKGWKVKSHLPVCRLDDHYALLKFFIKEGDQPLSDGHLLRSGRSSDVSIILRKGHVF